MLSGGRATPAALFVHGGTGKPGLVAQFDTLVFDEIANTEFRDPTATVSIFKDYMEYGNFSLGRFQVKGEGVDRVHRQHRHPWQIAAREV